MGYSHKQVVDRWVNGKKAKGMNMFTDGITIFSWGEHFPIAHKLKGGRLLFNTDTYSPSTSKHQTKVYCEIRE